MEVAYGSGDGDDEAQAIVAKKEATLGAAVSYTHLTLPTKA